VVGLKALGFDGRTLSGALRALFRVVSLRVSVTGGRHLSDVSNPLCYNRMRRKCIL